MNIEDLPAVLGLEWAPARDPAIFRSPLPRELYSVQSRIGLPAGMTIETIGHAIDPDFPGSLSGSTSVVVRPELADVAEIATWSAQAVEVAAAVEAEIAQRHRAHRKRIFDMGGADHAAAVTAKLAEARAMLGQWTRYVKDSARIREYLDLELLNAAELKKLETLLRRNRARLAAKLLTVSQAEADAALAHLDDEFVRASVLLLTSLDDDHSTDPNAEGWSRATTHAGHWCAGMLDTDPGLAIKEGRRLVAQHLGQLEGLGLTPKGVGNVGVL